MVDRAGLWPLTLKPRHTDVSCGGVVVRHPEPMPSSLRFDHDGRELTLDELADFIDDARRAKVPKHNPVRAELSKDGKIRLVEVLLEPDDD